MYTPSFLWGILVAYTRGIWDACYVTSDVKECHFALKSIFQMFNTTVWMQSLGAILFCQSTHRMIEMLNTISSRRAEKDPSLGRQYWFRDRLFSGQNWEEQKTSTELRKQLKADRPPDHSSPLRECKSFVFLLAGVGAGGRELMENQQEMWFLFHY